MFVSVGFSEKIFTVDGFRNWKKATGATGRLEKHLKSRRISKLEAEKKENQKVVEVIIDVIRHISLQNEAFRGHDEKPTSENQGKFQEEIMFLVKYHAPLKKWLDSRPENVSWLSHDIQNEMIDLLSQNVIETMKEQILESKYYSVECDDVTSHKKSYMSFIVRYVYQNVIQERVVGLKNVLNLKGKSLADIIIEKLGVLQIPLQNMIGKGFDGASNMSGKDNGVQQHLSESWATLSLYFHCFAHCLNLVLGKTAETLQLVKDVFDTIGSIYRVMEGSPQRTAVFEKWLKEFSRNEGRRALRSLSDTRWTARVDNLSGTANTLQALIAALRELEPKEAACAGLLTQLNSFEFVLKLMILKEVFEISKYASEYIKRADMDMVTAVDAVQTLIRRITSLRDEKQFDELICKAKLHGSKCNVNNTFNEASKRRRRLPERLGDGQTLLDATFSHSIATPSESSQSVTAVDNFRHVFYYPFLDLMLNELGKRFSVESCEVMMQLSAFNPLHWNAGNQGKVGKFTSRYDIPAQPTCQEYMLLRESRFFTKLLLEMDERKKKGWKNPCLPLILKMFQQSDLESLYPNLHLVIRIASCIPVSIASCERCHNKVKLINTYLRATMTEDRLENLVLISSERDISKEIDLSTIRKQFAFKPRKLAL